MSIRLSYWLFVSFILVTLSFLIYTIHEFNKTLFVLGEILMLLSIIFSIIIYQKLIAPLKFLSSSKEALLNNDYTLTYLKVGSKEMDELIEVYNRMIHNLREERVKYEEQKQFVSLLIEKSPYGIIIFDFDHNVEQYNEVGKNILDHFKDKNFDVGELLALEKGTSKVISSGFQKKYRIESVEIIFQGFPKKVVLIQDLTEEINEQEKKSFQTIIRMMAHEVNNTLGPVNSILGSVTNALQKDEGKELFVEGLEVATKRNQQLNSFMRSLADFVKIPDPIKQEIDVKRFLEEIIFLFKDQCQEKQIKVFKDFPINDVHFYFDPILMKQVFINIIKNAIEAIEEGEHSKGQISVSISPKNNSITVMDNGIGLGKIEQDRLFDSFYTSKREGQGIGLMVIKEILQKHQCDFDLYNDGDKTLFEITFPA